MSISTKTKLNRPNWCSAKPGHRFAYQWLDNVKNTKSISMANLIKRYYLVQELRAISLTDHDWWD